MLNKKTTTSCIFALILLSPLCYGGSTLIPENLKVGVDKETQELVKAQMKETQEFFDKKFTELVEKGIPVRGAVNITSEDMKALFAAGNIHITHEFAIKRETMTTAATTGVPVVITLGCFGTSFYQLNGRGEEITKPNVWVPAALGIMVASGLFYLLGKNDKAKQETKPVDAKTPIAQSQNTELNSILAKENVTEGKVVSEANSEKTSSILLPS